MLSANSVTRSEPDRPCWADIVMSNLGTSRVEAVRGEGGFFGELALANVSYLRIAHVTLKGAAVRGMRRRGYGGRQAYSWLAVSLGGGFELAYGGRSAVMGPGGMAILDARRTYVTTFAPDSEVLWVRVPQAFVQSQFAAATQITIDGARGAGRILFDAVSSVWTQAAHLDASQSQRIADGLVSMIAAAGAGREDASAEASAAIASREGIATSSSGLQRVKAFILENLPDESLSASSVAAANGLTARYINKLFEREGMSLMRWVWNQRLQAARAALARGQLDSHSIGNIAYAYGFKSASHFSHAFRRCFGHPPRAERQYGSTS
jgi:AraC family transcriptional activator of tynA and feaB